MLGCFFCGFFSGCRFLARGSCQFHHILWLRLSGEWRTEKHAATYPTGWSSRNQLRLIADQLHTQNVNGQKGEANGAYRICLVLLYVLCNHCPSNNLGLPRMEPVAKSIIYFQRTMMWRSNQVGVAVSSDMV